MTTQILKLAAVTLAVAVSAPLANAQFGSIGNRLKNTAIQKAENKAYQAVRQAADNTDKDYESVKSREPEKGDAKSEGMVMVNRATFKWDGKINHQQWNKSQKSTVTFSRFPADMDEFQQVRDVLGREPQGAAALMVMAMEMYHRDKEMGMEAIRMINTRTNYNSVISRLKEVMGNDEGYARPYLPAALLRGANPKNGYSPTEPYSIKVRVNPVTPYQESEMLDGVVCYLQIDSDGWDTNWRGIEVVQPDGEEFFLVSNCPALYTQCKKVKGTYKGLK